MSRGFQLLHRLPLDVPYTWHSPYPSAKPASCEARPCARTNTAGASPKCLRTNTFAKPAACSLMPCNPSRTPRSRSAMRPRLAAPVAAAEICARCLETWESRSRALVFTRTTAGARPAPPLPQHRLIRHPRRRQVLRQPRIQVQVRDRERERDRAAQRALPLRVPRVPIATATGRYL